MQHNSDNVKNYIETYTVKGVSFNMIRVEGGTFLMGATPEQGDDVYDDEKPVHKVTLSDYSIGETQVTQALWEAVMGTKPLTFIDALKLKQPSKDNPSRFKGASRPVENVSWNDCQRFIDRLNNLTGLRFRLPTEAEWEYAARGGRKSRGFKYAGSDKLADVAWFWDNSGYETHNVGQKQPNELGLYDMSGNVWEWCGDWYGNYDSATQTNPIGPAMGSRRVHRGGGWSSIATFCRGADRDSNAAAFRRNCLGFRLAL